MNLQDFMIGVTCGASVYAVWLATRIGFILEHQINSTKKLSELLRSVIDSISDVRNNTDDDDDDLCKPLHEMTQEEANKFFSDIAKSIQTQKTYRIVK